MNVSDEENELRDLFQHQFENESSQPPEAAWEQIRVSLPKPKRKRRIFAFLFTTLALTGILTGWLLYSGNRESQTSLPGKKTAQASGKTVEAKQKDGSADSTGSAMRTSETRQQKQGLAQTEHKITGVQAFQPASSKSAHKISKTKGKEMATAVPTGENHPRNQAQQLAATEAENGITIAEAPIAEIIATETEKPLSGRIPYKEISLFEINPESTLTNFYLLPVPKTGSATIPWSVEIFAGLGKNTRNVSGSFDGNNFAGKVLSDRKVELRNKFTGIQGGYSFNRYLTLQLGIIYGRNSVQSRWFNKLLKSQSGNEPYEFTTMEGSLKMEQADVNTYFQNNDSVYVKMRISNRSGYISLPVSLKLSLPAGLLVPYVRAGFSFDFKTSDATTLQVRNSYGQTRSTRFRILEKQTVSTVNAMAALGLATNTKLGLNLFGEVNYSRGLSPYYSKNDFKINSSFVQCRLGLSYAF